MLLPFVTEIFDLGFTEEPNYDKLKFSLVRILLDRNMTPNGKFNWSQYSLFEAVSDSSAESDDKQDLDEGVSPGIFNFELTDKKCVDFSSGSLKNL